MTDSRKAVVTGMGVVTPMGSTVDTLWDGLMAGRSGISRIEAFDPKELTTQIAGEVKGFDAIAVFGKKDAKRLDRFAQFGLVAVDQAMSDAGLHDNGTDPRRIGVYVGSGIGGLYTIEEQHQRMMEGGCGKVSPFLIPKIMTNAAAGQIAIRYGFKGPNWAIATACSSGSHAIGEATRAIEHGLADIMITGGTEATITPLGMSGFCSLKALSSRDVPPEKASCPFDTMRDGFVMSEGAGIIVLEEEEHARKRGARIYASVAGYGNTCDGHHITAPLEDGSGAADAMRSAFEDAGLTPEDIDYVNAHGTSTQLNDVMETKALKNVFGDRAGKVPVSSTKSMTGHLLGASGGLETIVCVLAMARGAVPPTMNLEHPDPQCDLDYVPNQARELHVHTALNNSFGFGGHNAALILQRY